ncbi:MAG: hypothetical protein HKN21_09860 [Candidatus Eisenbacteria bacterium]|uniref:Lipoprotein n=1 Tax=Eiseniibacteriota bacterium TaxID=2212470 RepID=A0A7Y2H2F9_UNCEI|nr:hypothetical protein [Candidatus Eisenbacteria bacterium]
MRKLTFAALVLAVAFASCNKQSETTDNSKPATEMTDQADMDAQVAAYPLKTCVISGDELGGDMGEPFNYMVEGRLVRLCCKMCVKEVDADPAAALAKLDEALEGHGSDHDHSTHDH